MSHKAPGVKLGRWRESWLQSKDSGEFSQLGLIRSCRERKTPGINQTCSRDNRLQNKDSVEFSRLGRIFSVNLNVIIAQVASECACASMTDIQHERYFVFTLADYRTQSLGLFFVELHRAAIRPTAFAESDL